MQPEPIDLIPPTHEQSTPSFHVRADLLKPFMEFLKRNGINILQPPGKLRHLGPHDSLVEELEIEAGTSTARLDALMAEFLARKTS